MSRKTTMVHAYIYFSLLIFLQVYGSMIFMSFQAYNGAPLVYFLRLEYNNVYYVKNVPTCKYDVGNMHIYTL